MLATPTRAVRGCPQHAIALSICTEDRLKMDNCYVRISGQLKEPDSGGVLAKMPFGIVVESGQAKGGACIAKDFLL